VGRKEKAWARRQAAARNTPPLPVASPPRVPTGKLARLLVAALRERPGQSYTPGELCLIVKAKKGNVKKELCRLLLPPRGNTTAPVQRTGKGLYACFLGPEELLAVENPQPKVHAIQLVWDAASPPLFGGFPPRSHAGAHAREQLFGPLTAQGAWVHDEASRSWRAVRWHEEYKLTLQHFASTGKLLVSVNASQKPLDAPALGHLRTWLQATLQAEGFTWQEPRVATVEINRDFERVRLGQREAARFYLGRLGLSGDRALRLGHLEGALVQIYNKEALGVMRQEVRLNPRDLDLPNLQALVESMFYGPAREPPPPAVASSPEGGYA